MSIEEDKEATGFAKFMQTGLGWIILIAAMAYAVISVVYNHLSYDAPDVTTVRISHWQLESGFRGALQDLIDDYEKQYFENHGKKVRILQLPISERGYRQFINTGLIGGTAPDIIEKGFAKSATDPAYVARFFAPLSKYAIEPNPYNEGTDLAGVPWKDTFFDGMQGAYDRTLLDFYYIPFSMFTTRVYYNVELYNKVMGTSETPKTFDEFIAACDKVAAYAEETGERIVPIAGSKQQAGVFRRSYEDTFTYDLISKSDSDFNGQVDVFESYFAYKNGTWNFNEERFTDSWQCSLDIAKNFQDGWQAAQRDDAAFLFIQKKAVMTASGSWDAPSLKKQSKFTIGVFDFPLPTNHPRYSRFVKYPKTEASIRGGIPWAINAHSKHKDLAIDFLRYCTTKGNNEQFNLAITWLPVVRGTKLSPDLIPFKPRVKGFSGYFRYDISTEVRVQGEGKRWNLYAGDISPQEYGKQMTEIYERSAEEGFENELTKVRRNFRNLERLYASQSASAFFQGLNDEPQQIERYQQLIQSTSDFGFKLAMRRAQFEAVNQKEGK